MKYLSIYLCLMLACLSCEDPKVEGEFSEESEADFAFGWSYGECGGDCATLYLYNNDALYLDDVPGYMVAYEDVEFQDVALENDPALQDARSLIEDFPDFLIETTEEVFGCPDCGDWGAIHIMLEIDGADRWWTLDNQIDGNPEEIQAWTQRVQDLIIQLSN